MQLVNERSQGDTAEVVSPERKRWNHHDWKVAAPRWLLLLLLAGAVLAATFLAGQVSSARTREQQRVEAALADVPSRYQARLAERVAVVESETTELRASIQQLAAEMKGQSQATMELTARIRELTAELRTTRR